MKVTLSLVPLVLGFMVPCYAMETKKIAVTPAMIKDHEEAFKKFIQELEQKKWPQMQKLPDEDSLFGSIVVGGINFIMENFTRYGSVRPKETKKFLGRVFEKRCDKESYEIPAILQQGLTALETGVKSDFLDYMNKVLNNLTPSDLEKQDLGKLAQVMEKEKKQYPAMPGSSNMSNSEKVPDDIFAPFAAAQLFTTCCIEERLLIADTKSKKSKHPHRSKKRESQEA